MDNLLSAQNASAGVAGLGATGYLTIDIAALCRNYEMLAAMVMPGRAAAVVKADAYGLGAERVSRALYARGCRHFFVAQFVEAQELRLALAPDAQVFVLNGLQPGAELASAEMGIIPVLNSLEQYRRWCAAARSLKRTLPAVLQFDTGMSRLGFPPEERSALAKALEEDGTVEVLFIMSHLASADELDATQNAEQLAEIRRIADEFAGFDISFANSGGVFLGNAYHGVLARPGIALYGGAPTAGEPNPMESVVSLEVAVVQTRTVPAGTKVGYSGVHVTDGEARLATIAAGYADGLPRSLSGRGAVYYEGIRLPIVGRVSMDSITIDVSALPEVDLSLGSLVEVIGPHQSLEDIARDAGTISYEILTSLGHRYFRHYR
ncbi:alanine racemase [Agrobacterium vitis]|uniref:Alanine racemase n=1 Tax=Agrobacterium vitis TaxID=373 RepID=A0A6L6VKG0_AGRVI|nr:alanine racemase [Agrobacterium vitis]MUZ74759.1 alanine racemase [Agrobacterium vitis]